MMSRLVASGLACAIACLPAAAQTVSTTAPAETAPPTTTATTTPAVITSTDDAVAGTADTNPPTIAELAIASDNPRSAPVISANVFDDVAVGSAVCWWRTPAGEWQQTALSGTGRFRLVRLPDGVQTQGFDTYLEVTDASGNITTAGTRGSPLTIPRAVEGNAERIKKQTADERAIVGPHPAWIMLALGVGVAAGGGEGIFAYDLSLTNTRVARNDEALDGALNDERRAALETEQTALHKVQTQDLAAASILGVVAAAGVVTGVVLLVIAVGAQE